MYIYINISTTRLLLCTSSEQKQIVGYMIVWPPKKMRFSSCVIQFLFLHSHMLIPSYTSFRYNAPIHMGMFMIKIAAYQDQNTKALTALKSVGRCWKPSKLKCYVAP